MRAMIRTGGLLFLVTSIMYGCKKDMSITSKSLGREMPSSPATPLCMTSISTILFAGSGIAGHMNGSSTSARLQPSDMVKDASGTVYFIEPGMNTIRKITPLGFVLDFAGSITPGLVNANGAAARFNMPRGLALDNAGNIIVADTYNHVIRKITPSGDVTTIAGGLGAGFVDDVIANAKFNTPTAVAVDRVNNDIYVLDAGNGRIRKIKQLSKVWTVAGGGTGGDGPALTAALIAPQDICFNTANNDLVLCQSNGKIRSLNTLTGILTTVASFPQSIMSVCMDDNRNIYFDTQVTATFPPYYIKQLNRSTGAITLLGGGTGEAGNINGAPDISRFNQPLGLWVAGDGSQVLVADYGNNMIRRIMISCL